MAASKHMQIRAAVAALLVAGTLLPAARIHQNRDLSLPTGVDSQVHINLASSDPTDAVIYTGNPRDWSTEIELIVLARKTASVEAADLADELWAGAYALVMANQSLGGLAEDLTPGGMQIVVEEGDTSFARLTWTFTVLHRTANDNITS